MKKTIVLSAVSVLFLVCGIATDNAISIVAFIISYILASAERFAELFEKLSIRIFLDEDFLMIVASIGAFIIGEYPEAIAVMLLSNIGEMFEEYAEDRSERSIDELASLTPDTATAVIDETERTISVSEIEQGSIIRIRAGQRIPVDGHVICGRSMVDTSPITGESEPFDAFEGQIVYSGSFCKDGYIDICADKKSSDSAAAKILASVMDSGKNTAKAETFIQRFASVWTPSVLTATLLIILIPTLITGNFSEWFYRGLTFLVVSCPCAVVISIPLAFFAAIGKCSRNGILVKGGIHIENIARSDSFFFDKTGTLTDGNLCVKEIVGNDTLKYAAIAESGSVHRIAEAIQNAYPGQEIADRTKENPGKGIEADYKGETIYAGNCDYLRENGFEPAEPNQAGTCIHVAAGNRYIGYITLEDELRNGAASTVEYIKSLGRKTVILTGDNKNAGIQVAKAVNADECVCSLLPDQKVKELENRRKGISVFIGDGINDAPVLASADVGIAMGGIGSDSTLEIADAVVMNDNIGKLKELIKTSRKTMRIVNENLYISIGVKLAILALSSFGMIGMWPAVLSDVGICILAIINSIRLMV